MRAFARSTRRGHAASPARRLCASPVGGARPQRGFTLIELMLVVVLVSVLAAIAIPSYDLFVKRSRRSEARAALSDLAAMQEQYFLDNKRYAPTLGDLGGRTVTENGYYAMSLPVATTFEYTIRATAQDSQADDTDCATMSVTRAGSKLPLDCW